MTIYVLTPLGKRAARSITDSGSPAWRVIRHLDRVGHASSEQIASYANVQGQELGMALRSLRRQGLIAEMGA